MSKSDILNQFKRVTLQCQGLNKTHPFGKGKKAVLSAVNHLGYVQIDSLSVIERAHHHTLWTRIPDYKNDYLNQILQEKEIFEYWFHAASYLPIKDFRYSFPFKQHFKNGESRYYNNVDTKTLKYVYDKILIDGPQKARDFKSPNHKPGKWWNWKPAKIALEKLFMQGDLMISGRDGMEKIYDITARVLPDNINTTDPTPLEFSKYLIQTYLRAYGVTTIKQITHLKTGKTLRKNVESVLQSMIEENTIQEIKLDGMPSFYGLNTLLESSIKKPSKKIHILSPFDNSIIHRDRVQQLFNFDFKLECYTPATKRQYGYFCLPILFGENFIGRIDCKAHRKTSQFELIHLHIEDPKVDFDQILNYLVKKIEDFAIFNGCKSIKVSKVSPTKYSALVLQAFKE